MMTLDDFVKESNRIEGISREPTWQEIDAHEQFLGVEKLAIQDLERLVSVCQPGAVLRSRSGLNVRVGRHVAPEGGLNILSDLATLLIDVNGKLVSPLKRIRATKCFTHLRTVTDVRAAPCGSG